MEKLDAQISQFFSGWSIYTTILAAVVVVWIAYPLLTSKELDTHPFLLARQSAASPVRQPGESAIYRSLESPHGYPLRSGLAVRDADAPKWSSGRDGDLRDVWRQAVRGAVTPEGVETGIKGKIMTVLGREQVVEHDLASLSQEINAVGQFIREHSGQRVAICLPNSVELLETIFGMLELLDTLARDAQLLTVRSSWRFLWLCSNPHPTWIVCRGSRQEFAVM